MKPKKQHACQRKVARTFCASALLFADSRRFKHWFTNRVRYTRSLSPSPAGKVYHMQHKLLQHVCHVDKYSTSHQCFAGQRCNCKSAGGWLTLYVELSEKYVGAKEGYGFVQYVRPVPWVLWRRIEKEKAHSDRPKRRPAWLQGTSLTCILR